MSISENCFYVYANVILNALVITVDHVCEQKSDAWAVLTGGFQLSEQNATIISFTEHSRHKET